MSEAFFMAWIGVVAAQAAPGPNLVAVAGVAMANGRSRALMVVFGVATGVLIWSALTAFGLAELLEAFPLSLVLMRFAGGGYLIWLALKALKSVVTGGEQTIQIERVELTPFRAWQRGLFVVLTNPKAMLMWAAVATYLFGAGLNASQVMLFGPLGMLSCLIVYGFYAIVFSSAVAVSGYSRFARGFEAIFAASFGALGSKLIFDGVQELRS